MARPQKNTVDYFPFICEDGNKMFYIEETYGNDGFAVFVKLLRELAKTNYHYLDLSKPTTMMFLSAKCKVTKETLESIINDLVMLEKFDSVLWKENKIIWCQDFIDSIQDAYIKRSNECISYEGLLQLLISLGIRKPIKRKSEGVVKPQTILDYTILEENKEDNNTPLAFSFYDSMIKYGFDKKLVSEWLKVRKTKKATNTETAFKNFTKEVEKTKEDINEVLTECIVKSWGGFKSDWYKKEPKKEVKPLRNLGI